MTTNLTKSLLEETREAFANYRQTAIEAAACLYDVHVGGAWEQVATSWGEYVQNELQISQSFASKLLKVYTHFCIDGGLKRDSLLGVDYEKLYLSAKLEGTPAEQLEKAKVLSRQELKLEKNDEQPHVGEFGEYCKICWVSRASHA